MISERQAQLASVSYLAYAVRNTHFLTVSPLVPEDLPCGYDEILAALLSCRNKGIDPTPKDILSELNFSGQADLSDSFHEHALMDISRASGLPNEAKLAFFQLQEFSKEKALDSFASNARAIVDGKADDVMTKLASIELALTKATSKSVKDTVEPIYEPAKLLINIILNAQTQGTSWGYKTGFTELDGLNLGFQPGQVIVLAGRPAMGKSALLLQIARYMAEHENIKSLVLSLEMSKEQMIRRFISSELGGTLKQQKQLGGLPESVVKQLPYFLSKLEHSHMQLAETPGLTLQRLRSMAAHAVKGGVKVIFLDYLQLMTGKGKSIEYVSEISKGIKELALEFKLTFFVAAQCNRNCEDRDDKRPRMSDLGESGQIERDADMIMFIYRDEVYDEHTKDGGIAEIVVRKNREGECGTIKLGFNGGRIQFNNDPIPYQKFGASKPVTNDEDFPIPFPQRK